MVLLESKQLFTYWFNEGKEVFFEFAPELIIAILIYVVGYRIIKRRCIWLNRIFKLRDIFKGQSAVSRILIPCPVKGSAAHFTGKSRFSEDRPFPPADNAFIHHEVRVDVNMYIAFSMDVEKARRIALDAIGLHPKVIQKSTPEIRVVEVGDDLIVLAVRCYTTQPHYWEVLFGVQELIKKGWDQHGIENPNPHKIIVDK
ncbi:hypothetical protein ABDK00_011270 [Niabella insulamsoli]|uniref:mechanosensitive ion channel family protein n=1 Tax=Niabella insulamsoli TaxID=3144874 RepID=UPI0031FBE034